MIRRLRNNCFVLAALVAWPTMALGQVSLTELGAANAARNQMMANGANAAAGAAPQAAAAPKSATPSVGFGGMKYVLSYSGRISSVAPQIGTKRIERRLPWREATARTPPDILPPPRRTFSAALRISESARDFGRAISRR